MGRFTLLILALALPWLLLTAAFAFFNIGDLDTLRLARFPQQHAPHLRHDLIWEEWLPFHHMDSTGVRLLGTGDSFSDAIVTLANQHLPASVLPHRIETRANRGIISTARASRCLIAEVDSGQYTDFLLVNVERGFRQIGAADHLGCDPETPVRPRATLPGLPPSDDPPTPFSPPTPKWADYWKVIRSHSIRDVFDFFWYNTRRTLFQNLPEDLPSFKMPAREVPMTCGLHSDAPLSDHVFIYKEELHRCGSDTTGFAATFASLRSVRSACQAKGMRFHMILVPDKSTVYTPWLGQAPHLIDDELFGDAYYRHAFAALEASDLFEGPDAGELVNALDLINAYHASGGRDAFTHGDTHWSLTGAGLAFREFLGRSIPREEK